MRFQCIKMFCFFPIKVDFHLVQNIGRATAKLLKLNTFLLGSIRELLRQKEIVVRVTFFTKWKSTLSCSFQVKYLEIFFKVSVLVFIKHFCKGFLIRSKFLNFRAFALAVCFVQYKYFVNKKDKMVYARLKLISKMTVRETETDVQKPPYQ